MKNIKKNKHNHPFHLHLEYFFRKQYCLLFVAAFLMLAVLRSDNNKVAGIVRQASHGFGVVGEYMREETTRMPVTFNISARVPTYSGK